MDFLISVTLQEYALYIMWRRIFQIYSKIVKPSQTNNRYVDANQQCQHLKELYILYYVQYFR